MTFPIQFAQILIKKVLLINTLWHKKNAAWVNAAFLGMLRLTNYLCPCKLPCLVRLKKSLNLFAPSKLQKFHPHPKADDRYGDL